MAATSLLVNSFWADKALYDDAEKRYYENLAQLQKESENPPPVKSEKKGKSKKNKTTPAPVDAVPPPVADMPPVTNGSEKKKKKNKNANKSGDNTSGGGGALEQKSSLASEVAKARQHIKASLESMATGGGKSSADSNCRSGQCGAAALADALKAVQGQLQSLEKRVASLEIKCASCPPAPCAAAAKPASAKSAPAKDEDDDVDLFGSDSEEDEEAAKIKEQRLADYAARKSKKPALIAKSNIILDIKPWDDETDMKAMETAVRAIVMDGLLWGASKLVPVGYGIHKLQISSVVEDDKVSVDLLQEQIEAIEELVQSVDIAAFNKI